MLVVISSISAPFSNCLYAKRVNSGKITTFRWVAVFNARLRKPP